MLPKPKIKSSENELWAKRSWSVNPFEDEWEMVEAFSNYMNEICSPSYLLKKMRSIAEEILNKSGIPFHGGWVIRTAEGEWIDNIPSYDQKVLSQKYKNGRIGLVSYLMGSDYDFTEQKFAAKLIEELNSLSQAIEQNDVGNVVIHTFNCTTLYRNIIFKQKWEGIANSGRKSKVSGINNAQYKREEYLDRKEALIIKAQDIKKRRKTLSIRAIADITSKDDDFWEEIGFKPISSERIRSIISERI